MTTGEASEPDMGGLSPAVMDLLTELGKPELGIGETLSVDAEMLHQVIKPDTTEAVALGAVDVLAEGVRAEQRQRDAELLGQLASLLAELDGVQVGASAKPDDALRQRARVALAMTDAAVGRASGAGRTTGIVMELEQVPDVVAALQKLADVKPAKPELMADRCEALAEALARHGFDAECPRWVAAAYRERAVTAREGA